MNRNLIWPLTIGGILILIFGLAKIAAGPSVGTVGNSISESDHTKGADNGSVVLVEFSDFQCPACASAYPLLSRLASDYSEDLTVVYRHYPLRQIHPNAQIAAQAAEAAALQGMFWDFHDMLFNTQGTWSNLGLSAAKDHFAKLASSIGMDEAQFRSDMDSDAAKDAVNEDYKTATAVNAPGTPTLFLDGELVNLQSYEQLSGLVEAAINAK